MGPAAGNVEGLQKAGSGELSGYHPRIESFDFYKGISKKLPSYVGIFFSGSQLDQHIIVGFVSLVYFFTN